MSFHAGGTGARPGADGLSATAFPSGVKNVPIEVNEAVSPIVVWRKEYRQDSGGAGEFRGGLGQIMEVGTLDKAPFALSAYYDRIDHPARGREGGKNGLAGRLTLASGKVLRGKGLQTVTPKDRVIIAMPGGGGLGDPRRRPVAVVACGGQDNGDGNGAGGACCNLDATFAHCPSTVQRRLNRMAAFLRRRALVCQRFSALGYFSLRNMMRMTVMEFRCEPFG